MPPPAPPHLAGSTPPEQASARLVGQRDQARSIAVRLEQDLARAAEALQQFLDAFNTLIATEVEVGMSAAPTPSQVSVVIAARNAVLEAKGHATTVLVDLGGGG